MNFLDCPNELLYDIFLQESITVIDLCNLMSCCHRFYDVIRSSNELWRKKFKQRWPQLSKLDKGNEDVIWLEMFVMCSTVGREVRKTLKELSPKCYPIGQPPLYLLNHLVMRESPIPDLVENQLLDIIFHQPNINENLTSRYYARQMLRYVRRFKLQKDWKDLMRQPESQKSLLAGAVLISRWGQMEKEHLPSLEEVDEAIEQIAQRVKQLMTGNSKLNVITGKDTDFTEEPSYVRVVLNNINQVLYSEMGFQGNKEDYYNPENSYIEKVIQTRKGIPITLCIIYHEVAKKLGILCEPVSFPQHFLLRWREHPEKDIADSFTYIDAFNSGASHQPRSCPALIGQPRQHVRREAYAAVPAEHVFQRMVNNLIQCSRYNVHEQSRPEENRFPNPLHFARLACAVSPGQTPSAVAFAELCVFHGTQLEEAINLLQAEDYNDETMVDLEPAHWSRVRQITMTKCANKLAEQQKKIAKVEVCRRQPSVKFAVGMVLRYENKDGLLVRRFKCVVISWDHLCQGSDEWKARSLVHNLSRGVHQPFYHVLMDSGGFGYVAEETLELLPPGSTINHPDLGLHFERFNGRWYEANEELRIRYPDDEAFSLSSMTD